MGVRAEAGHGSGCGRARTTQTRPARSGRPGLDRRAPPRVSQPFGPVRSSSSMLTQPQSPAPAPTHLARRDLTVSSPQSPLCKPFTRPSLQGTAQLPGPLPAPRPRPLLHAHPWLPPPGMNQGATPGGRARSSGSPASWRQSHRHYLLPQDAPSTGHELLLCCGKRSRDIIL